jgi:hypothetical protein
MVAIMPPMLIDKPTPEFPLRYGLLQAAVGPLDLPDHAITGGLRYVTGVCGPGFGYEVNCLTSLGSKTFSTGLNTVVGVPFVVYATVQCGTVGYDFAEQNRFARERLFSVEQTVVEQIFSAGTFAQAPSLANNAAAVTVAGGGVTVGDVLSELENAVYCTGSYGPQAYIHAPLAVLNELKVEHLIEFDGLRWRTPMGSIVSAGCYANLSPVGVAPANGTFWMYATGQTTVWRSPDSKIIDAPVEGVFNRTTNQMMTLVERPYVVAFECGIFAKTVTLWP